MTFPSGPHRRRAEGDASVGDRRGPRRWAPSPSTRGRCAARTPSIPTSCASTWTRSPAPASRRPRAVAVDVLKPLLDELGLVGYPKTSGGRGRARLPADRDRLGLHRGAPGRHRAGPRDRAARAGRGHHVVVEGGARRADLHRLQPERPRPHLRVGVLGARDPDRHGVDAADLGRTAPTPIPTTSPSPPCRTSCQAAATRGPTSTTIAQSIEPLLEMVTADEERGLGDLPYPPNYPKMPGEPQRVQPSKKVAAQLG